MDAEEGRENKRVNLHLHLLPLEILLEILSRLPITSLIHFKTTSHAGYNLIADPRLPPMFRNRVSDSDPCLILFNYYSFFSRRLYFLDTEGCSRGVRKIDPPQHSDLADPKKRKKKKKKQQHSELYNLVGSCNGLLCLSFPKYHRSSESHSLLIYNPFVGDAVRVPPANRLLDQSEVFGFGFHPRTGEFKVVRIVSYGSEEELDMVQVFTVGTTKWREKGAPPPQVTDDIGPPKALVEGSLYWVTDVRIEGVGLISGIISFELAGEVFEEIPHPPCQRFVSREYDLSVLNGCLLAAGLVDDTLHFDIWVMKQYRVKESWVKQFSFDPNFPGGCQGFCTVICALKTGEILLKNEDGSLLFYDPVENRFKTLQISGLKNRFQAFPFLPSLLSAKATMNLQL